MQSTRNVWIWLDSAQIGNTHSKNYARTKCGFEQSEVFTNFAANWIAPYVSLIQASRQLCWDPDEEPQFKPASKKVSQFDYEHPDESPQTPEDVFRVNFSTSWYYLSRKNVNSCSNILIDSCFYMICRMLLNKIKKIWDSNALTWKSSSHMVITKTSMETNYSMNCAPSGICFQHNWKI